MKSRAPHKELVREVRLGLFIEVVNAYQDTAHFFILRREKRMGPFRLEAGELRAVRPMLEKEERPTIREADAVEGYFTQEPDFAATLAKSDFEKVLRATGDDADEQLRRAWLWSLKEEDWVCFLQPTSQHPEGERPYILATVHSVGRERLWVTLDDGNQRIFSRKDGMEIPFSFRREQAPLPAKLEPISPLELEKMKRRAWAAESIKVT